MLSLQCLCSAVAGFQSLWLSGGMEVLVCFVFFFFLKRDRVSNLAMKKVRIGEPVVSAVSF